MAGLTAACAAQRWASVVVFDKESQIGYHASGRSAALFSVAYGNTAVRAFSVASREALEAGEGFETRRGTVHFCGPEDGVPADRLATELTALLPDVVRLLPAEVATLVPAIDAGRTCGGVFEPNAMDIDTNKVLQRHPATLRARGGVIRLGEEILTIERAGDTLRVVTATAAYQADMVINARGVWADLVPERAGMPGLGLIPKRRTASIFDAPGFDIRSWSLVVDLHERFYFKPDAGRLIGSLADETDSLTCDAYPDDMDVALAVHRIEVATKLRISRPQTPWAGLPHRCGGSGSSGRFRPAPARILLARWPGRLRISDLIGGCPPCIGLASGRPRTRRHCRSEPEPSNTCPRPPSCTGTNANACRSRTLRAKTGIHPSSALRRGRLQLASSIPTGASRK